MADLVLRGVDEALTERVRRIAERRGWELSETLLYLLQRGLHGEEGDGAHFDHSEADALQEAIVALQQVPDDPGYARIGREALGAEENPPDTP